MRKLSWVCAEKWTALAIAGVLVFGGLIPSPALANHEQGHEEAAGICPQPRNTPAAPEEYLKMTNPVQATPQNILAGKTLFQFDAQPSACRICHGISGDGLGIMFTQVDKKPRNFTCYQTMDDLPDGQLYWIIKNGSPGTAMPSFKYLDDDQVWQLILYIRSFSEKK